MKRLLLVPALLALCAATFVTRAVAAPITFIFTGTGSGTLTEGAAAGIVFEGANFTLTILSDTNTRESYAQGYFVENDSASISIDGLGTFEFLFPTTTFINNANNTTGFTRSQGDLLHMTDPALAGWDMLSPFGPLAGNVRLLQWGSGALTDGGTLFFENSTLPGAFTAIVGTAAVPDASATLLLLGMAGGAFAAARRRMAGA